MESTRTIIEISGPLEDGMWAGRSFYPPVAVDEIEPIPWPRGEGRIYGQRISFGSQSGTSVVTGAHLYPGAPSIADVPLDRLMTSAVIARVVVEPNGRVTLGAVRAALEEQGEEPVQGDALLIATGWDAHWNDEGFLRDSPRLSGELVAWAIERKVAILGSDLPSWDADWSEGFWPSFYASGVLLLAPLVNLCTVPRTRLDLVALPLAIRGSCGSPCRAFLKVPR
jgi:arylformamidase